MQSAQRRRTIAAAMLVTTAALLAACSQSPTAEPTANFRPDPAAPAPTFHATVEASGPGSECGTVTHPQSGAAGTIAQGSLSCTEAMAVVDRYLHDPWLAHSGNTWSAEFDGWACASPTAAAAEEYGYTTACNRGTDEVQVRPGAVTTTGNFRAAPPPAGCDPASISADLGQQLNVQRCYGDWAYVSTGELGDAQSLLRLVNGTWSRYTGFPSSICRGQAAGDGVPEAELSSFPPC